MVSNTGHPATSWYAQTATPFPALPALEQEIRADVCVVGAGYTGLGAALELAQRGVSVVMLEAAQVGSGGSGRNGGQVHVGQRNDQAWLEKVLGRDDALRLWAMSQDARTHLLALIAEHDIACDFVPGMIHARHRKGGEAADAAHIDFMAARYGYDQLAPIGEEALAQELGTDVYHGGLIDHGGGHLHPLNLALGMARAALAAGATIFERTRAVAWRRQGGSIVVETPKGRVICDQLILTGDGYLDDLAGGAARARVMPINNFILATEPLSGPLGARADQIIRSNAAVADTRFVVNYFRKSPDGRLIFGGGENYRPGFPPDLKAFVRRRMLQVYPDLADVAITHAWGGTLGITVHRAPFVRDLAPGVRIAAGYSGQGVMLAPWFGKLLADAVLGDGEELALLARLPTPPFPGGRLLRWPLTVAGLSWYAMRDRL